MSIFFLIIFCMSLHYCYYFKSYYCNSTIPDNIKTCVLASKMKQNDLKPFKLNDIFYLDFGDPLVEVLNVFNKMDIKR